MAHGIGTLKARKGSNVFEFSLHFVQISLDLSYPYIKSTMTDLFRAENVFQCSGATIWSYLPFESDCST